MSFTKNYVKNCLRKHPEYSFERITKKIKHYDVVSFDIFDTLIKRNVSSPTDVFYLAAQKCFSEDLLVSSFEQARIEAEKIARSNKNKEEIGLTEIYEELDNRFTDYSESLKQMEIETEIEVSYSNPVMKKVYEWCVRNNKRIILITDMYLDKTVIEEILNKNGYIGHYSIFVSSEIGLQKSTGNLFRFVMQEQQIEGKKWIHIGDSLKGDYLGPKRNGISAIRIASNPSRTQYIKKIRKTSLVWNSLEELLSGHLIGNETSYYRYGLEALSPLISGFCIWLHNKAINERIDTLFFLSRDGFLLQKAYKELYGSKAIKNSYLYISRRALRLPVFYMCESLREFISYIPQNKFFTKNEIFDLFGLNSTSMDLLWEKSGFSEDELLLSNTLIDNSKFLRFYSQIERECKKKSKEYIEILIEYLKENGFEGNIGIVDIGWNGTIQKSLSRIIGFMGKNINLRGYYVGLTEESERELKGHGFIPSHYKPQVATAGLFEYPFLAQEGSVEIIKRVNDSVVPQLYLYEYENDIDNKRFVNEIQKGVIDGVRILQNSKGIIEKLSSEEAYRTLWRITKNPSYKESIIFGDMRFFDGSSNYLAKPQQLWKYCYKPKMLLKDFSNSGWKIGFLKRMFVIPFPYATLLERMKEK